MFFTESCYNLRLTIPKHRLNIKSQTINGKFRDQRFNRDFIPRRLRYDKSMSWWTVFYEEEGGGGGTKFISGW